MRRSPSAAVFVCLLTLTFFTRSAKASTIDQQVLANGGGLGSSGLTQTFTVGLAGNLVGVDVGAWSDAPATLYILGTTAGVPDSTKILRSQIVSIPFASQDAGHFQPTIPIAPLPISVGDQLAIALVLGPGGSVIAWTQTATPYAGGEVFNIPDGIAANRYVPLGVDAGFRTYVDVASTGPSAVPEPASLSLLAIGLFGTAVRLRRRR